MSLEGAGFAKGSRRAILAALCSLLLASCSSTSDPALQLGLAPADANSASAISASADETGDLATISSTSTETTVAGAPVPSRRPDADAPAQAEAQQLASAAAPATTITASITPATAESPAAAAAASSTPAAEAAQNEKAEAAEKPAEQAAGSAAKSDAEAPTDAAAGEGDASATSETAQAEALEPKKRGFLAAFFSPARAKPNPASKVIKEEKKAEAEGEQPAPAAKPLVDTKEEAKPIITLASASSEDAKPVRASFSGDALPGVRQGDGLFEITSKSGTLEDDGDVDIYEDEDVYQVASAAGLARLAPNGLLKQRESVDVSCLKPSLVRMIRTIESHYGRRAVITSGYRSPTHNRRVRGARKSLHMYCAAADIQVQGVSKWELARFVRSMPGRGGVGTYCHTNSVHVDVGPERDWNWRCRRRS
ncbi:MAG TPA: D-Ala-D-Ala carboxypeptidase family metallohydrolase [Rhizobiaceae bacterium]|nr:D-Ala-D-Ala carboxypeptidase family metallohydrolase [Rhizobiaceae bacterium]